VNLAFAAQQCRAWLALRKMKIERVTLYKVNLPMIIPFTLSYGTLTEKPTVIVKVETSEGITGYGEAASFNIAIASLPNFIYPLDMTWATEFFSDDLTRTTFMMDDGYIGVTEGPGLGYEVDEEKIEQYTVEKWVLTEERITGIRDVPLSTASQKKGSR
jgi:L-alanine-DL-glutamate epimerase-like enolase superfamily enzyme